MSAGRFVLGRSVLDAAIVAYLGLPLVGFALWSLRPFAAALLLLLIAVPGWWFARSTWPDRLGRVGWSWWAWVVAAAALASVWAVLGGADHIFFANSDWAKHDAVLTDLVRYPWPVTYLHQAGGDLALRYYEGLYVVPALAGKAFGHAGAWMLAWIGAGAFLVLARLGVAVPSWSRRILVAVLFMVFGGMDIIGFVWENGTTDLHLHTHLEHWTMAAFNNDTTLLFWVPQHALSAWLATLIIVDREDRTVVRALPFLVAVVTFWSVFATMGMLVVALPSLVRVAWRRDWRAVVDVRFAMGVLAAAGIVGYLRTGSGSTLSAWIWDVHVPADVRREIPRFLALELGGVLLGLRIACRRLDRRVWLATIVLALMSLYVLGAFGDFTMRASVPLLMILFLAVRQWVVDFRWRLVPVLTAVPLVVALGIGAVTASTEAYRAVDFGASPPDTTSDSEVLLVTGLPPQVPSQYVAPVPSSLRWAMRAHPPELLAASVRTDVAGSWDVPCCTHRQVVVTGDARTLRVRLDGVTKAELQSTFLLRGGTYRVRADVRDPVVAAHVSLGVVDAQVLPFDGRKDGSRTGHVDQYVTALPGQVLRLDLKVDVPEGITTVQLDGFTVEKLDPAPGS